MKLTVIALALMILVAGCLSDPLKISENTEKTPIAGPPPPAFSETPPPFRSEAELCWAKCTDQGLNYDVINGECVCQ